MDAGAPDLTHANSTPNTKAPSAPTAAAEPVAVRVPPELWAHAASRLVGQSLPDVLAAGRRLVDAASRFGLDFRECWGVVDPDPAAPIRVRQACLASIGVGRTAMLFISEPPRGGDPGGPAQGLAERVASVRMACAELGREVPARAHLAQGLPDPTETWSVTALRHAGFTSIGTLEYLTRPGAARVAPEVRSLMVLAPAHTWPPGVVVRRVDEVGAARDADRVLVDTLDRTYVATLDCPELCGLRATADILASHKATGAFDPSLWWILEYEGVAEGCCLMSAVPESRSLELVYLGLSPRVRGMRLGSRLLGLGITNASAHHRGWPVMCAVDQRNAPARGLYARFGFEATGRREALVMPLRGQGAMATGARA
jgi:GNAT superfamily N-acetyltransferase